MSDTDNQKRRVQDFVARKIISKRQLALLAGLRPTTLTHLEYERWNPEQRTLAKLTRAIDRWERKTKKRPKTRVSARDQATRAA